MCLDHNLIPCTDAKVNFLVFARHIFPVKQQSTMEVMSQVPLAAVPSWIR